MTLLRPSREPIPVTLDGNTAHFIDGTGTPVSVLVPLTNQLGGDVALTLANTYYDGPSLTLGAGVWLLISTVTVIAGVTGPKVTAKLWDGTTVTSSAEHSITASTSAPLTLIGVVTSPGATYKVSCAADQTGCSIKAAAPTNGAGNTASTLVAVKIG